MWLQGTREYLFRLFSLLTEAVFPIHDGLVGQDVERMIVSVMNMILDGVVLSLVHTRDEGIASQGTRIG